LDWSSDKDDALGLAKGLCYMTLNPKPKPKILTQNLNPKPKSKT